MKAQKSIVKFSFFTPLLFVFLYIVSMQSSFAASPPAIYSLGGIVVSANKIASQVGADILEKKGNAFDAAVAVAYALAVVEPCCGNIGGGGFLILQTKNGEMKTIDFRETAPSRAAPQMFLDKDGKVDRDKLMHSYLSAGIPGTVMGLSVLHEKYGSMPFRKLLLPAIKLAEEGFIVTEAQEHAFDGLAYNTKSPEIKKIFTIDGRSYRAGDKLVQKDLSNTLKKIAAKGSNVFYKGSIAKAIVKASKTHGGAFTMADFANYKANIKPPLVCKYRSSAVYTTPPPSSGMVLCEMLAITESYPMEFLGYHSAASAHYSIEAMRYAFADRNQYLADPQFTNVPVSTILSPKHIKDIQSQIQEDKAGNSKNMGATLSAIDKPQTTHFSIDDINGNKISLTYSLNGYFGAQVIPKGTGILLNNTMDDFTIKVGEKNVYGLQQGKANLVAGGKRPASSMTPTFVSFPQEQANRTAPILLILGTPGGSTIPTQLLLVIQNAIDYGMPIRKAIDAPRFHMQWMPDLVYIERFTFSKDTKKILELMGYSLQFGSPYHFGEWGAVAGIEMDPETGGAHGAMDARRPNGAAIGTPWSTPTP